MKINLFIKIFWTLIFQISVSVSIAQQNIETDIFYNLKTFNINAYKIKQAIKLTSSSSDYHKNKKQFYDILCQLIESGVDSTIVNSLPKLKAKSTPFLKSLNLMVESDVLQYDYNSNTADIFNNYHEALEIALDIKHKSLICELSKRILTVISQNSFSLDKYPFYLEIYQSHAMDNFEKINSKFLELNYTYSSSDSSMVKSFKKNLKRIPKNKDFSILKARHYRMIGVNFDLFEKNYDSALHYHQKSLNIYRTLPYFIIQHELFTNYLNIGIVHNQNKAFKKSNNFLYKTLNLPLRKDKLYNKELVFDWIKDNHINLNQIDSALYYLQKKIEIKEQIDELKNSKNINYLVTKFQTAEKEKQNLLLQSEVEKKQRQQRNLWLGGSIILIFLSITGFLIYKNTKRKQLLAEQEKALESQKLSTVLKEQELNSIDAMIAGQEKERQRIANDLHDDLGSLMANVKLHFDALKDNPSPELYTKANILIETAYDKIRGMAHAKNSGVMANKGLLKAINDIANSNSITNKLHIQVVDYGLEQQLENSLELTIFRIIQELIANIIKHAEATEATIHITNHEDTINLMVEDNGKGFDTKTISKHQGMGIHSIDKRIENLGGTVTIESEINKGTTVIIDIPTL